MRPSVVLSGSFKREPAGLQAIFHELDEAGCRILSPMGVNFVDITTPVVRTPEESDLSIAELQRFHLRAIRSATFLWLHAPLGYVGVSAAYELGYADVLHKPIFSKDELADEMLATRGIHVVRSVVEALEQLPMLTSS